MDGEEWLAKAEHISLLQQLVHTNSTECSIPREREGGETERGEGGRERVREGGGRGGRGGREKGGVGRGGRTDYTDHFAVHKVNVTYVPSSSRHFSRIVLVLSHK